MVQCAHGGLQVIARQDALELRWRRNDTETPPPAGTHVETFPRTEADEYDQAFHAEIGGTVAHRPNHTRTITRDHL
jgi:hypothetical protein